MTLPGVGGLLPYQHIRYSLRHLSSGRRLDWLVIALLAQLSDYWSKKADFKFVLTPDGKSTLRDFMQYFSVEELKKAMDIAFSKPFLKNIEDKFRYFCGIVHNWKSDKFDKGERSILKRAKSYFQSKPRGSGYFVDGRFIKYVSLFDWDTIKLAIDDSFCKSGDY